MRFGWNHLNNKSNPEKWAKTLVGLNVKAAAFPVDFHAAKALIDDFVKQAEENDIMIAEVGAWCNMMDPSESKRKANIDYIVGQLKLADYVGARCCVNISGANGPKWDSYYPGNYDEAFYDEVVKTIRDIIIRANPKRTVFAIEPMPWQVPTSPDAYVKLIRDVDSPFFAVHMDMVNWINSMDRLVDQRAFMKEAFMKLQGHIVSCHLKDVQVINKMPITIHECPVGQGVFDVRYYLDLIEQEDPDMPVLIEHQKNGLAFRRSMKYVTKTYSEYANGSLERLELQQEQQLSLETAALAANFDPNTGLPLEKPKEAMNFDPETGEPLKKEEE